MRRVIAATVAAAAMLGLPGTRLGSQQTTVTVDIREFSFEPRELMVPAGATVRWMNRDDFPHSVIMAGNQPGGSRGSIAPGGEHTFIFAQAGRFTYRCGVHPTMLGEITVAGL